MNYQGLMEITKIENIADDVYEMTLKGEGAKYISQPGQFINIKINESLQPYLRRPMSISDYDENTIVIVFKVVGQGTEILKNKQIGDQLDCLIGLGNGFTVQEGKALLIGGGLGTPPLYNLGKKLKETYKENLEDNFYKSWIESYSCEGYEQVARTSIEFVNTLSENIDENKKEKLKDIFIKASIHEMKFWDMAYEEVK